MVKRIAVAVAAVALSAPFGGIALANDTVVRLGADVDAGTLDPRIMRDTTAYRVNNLLYDGLVQLDANLQPVPDLAVEWENPEPTVWIFHLRDGVTFHDGSAFTAEDVVYTFETILDPDLNARFRSLYTPIESIEAVDPLTVRIELTEPYAPLLSYLDMGIVPKDFVEGGGDLSSNPVGTGPMRLAEWERGSRIALEPYDDYWAGEPESGGFEFVVVADNTARAQAFEAGDLDIIQSPLSPQDIQRLSTRDDIGKSVMGGLGITYLNFNTQSDLLSDPAMRRALAMLVDQDAIVNGIYEGVDQVADSILLPSSWAHTPDIKQPGFDPAGAVAALADLGWTDSDNNGVLDKDGEDLVVQLSTHSEDPNRIQAVEFIQATFKQNGVDAKVSITDWPAFFPNVQSGGHEIALLGWLNIVDPDRLMFAQFISGGGQNYGGYANPTVDDLLRSGRSGRDLASRIESYQAAAKILAEEMPYYVISYQGYQVFHNPDVALSGDARGMMRSAVGF